MDDCDDCIDYEQLGLGPVNCAVLTGPLRAVHSELTLYYVSIPFVIIGVISNVLILWIWQSTKSKPYEKPMVYFFKALTVSDLIYLALFLPTIYFSRFNFHMGLLFNIACYGHRTIAVYITLMLAIIRYIKLFFPLRVQQMVSYFRLRLSLTLITFSCISLQTFEHSKKLFLYKQYHLFTGPLFGGIIMSGLPAVLQNVLMMLVVLKLRKYSKTVRATSSYDAKVLHFSEKGQVMTEQEIQEQPAHDPHLPSVQTENLIIPKRRETACDAGPLDLLASVDGDNTAGSDQKAAEQQVTAKQGDVIAKVVVEPTKQRDTISVPNKLPTSTVKTSPRSSTQQKTSSSPNSLTCGKQGAEFDHGIIYVVLAICLCTFFAYVVLAPINGMFNLAHVLKINELNYVFTAFDLLIHGINLVFYLFISRFRQTLVIKGKRLMGRYMSTSVKKKATHLATGDSEGRSLNSITVMKFPHRSVNMTASKLNAYSSSKFPHGREGMATSQISMTL